jgi:hypothetical protein
MKLYKKIKTEIGNFICPNNVFRNFFLVFRDSSGKLNLGFPGCCREVSLVVCIDRQGLGAKDRSLVPKVGKSRGARVDGNNEHVDFRLIVYVIGSLKC